MWKLLDKIIFLFNLPIMAGLAGAYCASFIDPEVLALPSLLGLAYPYLLIANLCLLPYWIFRWKRTAWAVLTVTLLGIPAFTTYYGTARVQDREPKADLSVLSYNVRYFDAYGWSNDKNTSSKLFGYLNAYRGDLICLQEFNLKPGSPEEQTVVKRLHTYPYHYIHGTTAIFSRRKILRHDYLTFPATHRAAGIYCDLKTAKDTVRLYSVHLESFRLGEKERAFMKEIGQGINGNQLSDGTRHLIARLTAANKRRARQAAQIRSHIAHSPHPVVLCGDFNDTPLSYTYREIKNGLKDAFIECGRGIGNTYIGELPSFRIDYILHSPRLKAVSYLRDTVTFSDHYPIRARLCHISDSH